jgi:cobalt/nickel transport system permease protein
LKIPKITADTLVLFLYCIAMVAISSLTDWPSVTILFLIAALVFYRDAVQAIAKSVVLVGPFLLVTAAATVLYSRLVSGGYNNWELVGTMSARVLLLAFLTFVFVRRVNLIEALSFSRSLSVILAVAMAQIFLYRRLATDFQLALRSRSARKPGALGTLRGASTLTGSCLLSSIQHGREVADAMRSRGV